MSDFSHQFDLSSSQAYCFFTDVATFQRNDSCSTYRLASGEVQRKCPKFQMTRVDWRWAADKGFWDKERKVWIESSGGMEAYLAQRNQRVVTRKERKAARSTFSLDKKSSRSLYPPPKTGLQEELDQPAANLDHWSSSEFRGAPTSNPTFAAPQNNDTIGTFDSKKQFFSNSHLSNPPMPQMTGPDVSTDFHLISSSHCSFNHRTTVQASARSTTNQACEHSSYHSCGDVDWSTAVFPNHSDPNPAMPSYTSNPDTANSDALRPRSWHWEDFPASAPTPACWPAAACAGGDDWGPVLGFGGHDGSTMPWPAGHAPWSQRPSAWPMSHGGEPVPPFESVRGGGGGGGGGGVCVMTPHGLAPSGPTHACGSSGPAGGSAGGSTAAGAACEGGGFGVAGLGHPLPPRLLSQPWASGPPLHGPQWETGSR